MPGVKFSRAAWKGLMPKEAPMLENSAGLAAVGSCSSESNTT